MADLILKARTGGLVDVGGTAFAALANGSGALASVVVDPAATGTGDGPDPWADLDLVTTAFASAPTAGGGLECYACVSHDGGTTYEDVTTGASPVPPQHYLGLIPVDARAATQHKTLAFAPLPIVKWKLFIINRCGQALPSTATIKRQNLTESTV